MKKFEKMTAWEFAVFFLMAICAGAIIGIGGASSLLANALLGVEGRILGATLFSLGIYAILVFEMRLFTGMIADIPTLGVKNWWRLAVCFLGNILGVALAAFLAYNSPIGEKIVEQGATLIQDKLNADNWAFKALCSAMLCGALITISVKSVQFAPKKGVSATVGVIFPVIVFAFCGFDHSVANMMYFYYLGECSWRVVGYVLLSVLGNILGGVALPCITLVKERALKDKQKGV